MINRNHSLNHLTLPICFYYLRELVKTLIKNLLNWFRWHRKLSRALPRLVAEPHQSPPVSPHKILISILQGKNLPQRDGAGHAQFFVEITFEDFSYTSSTKSGAKPVWNEAIELPIKYVYSCKSLNWLRNFLP